jgi:hypothetical protein
MPQHLILLLWLEPLLSLVDRVFALLGRLVLSQKIET